MLLIDLEFLILLSKEKSKEKEELNDSMGKLHIEGSSSGQLGTSSTNFKRKPVIIIVVGMAGNLINLLVFLGVFLGVFVRPIKLLRTFHFL